MEDRISVLADAVRSGDSGNVEGLAAEYREEEEDAPLTREHRERLTALLRADVLLAGERHSVGYAVEKVVQSLLRCFGGEADTLLLPELLPLAAHRYDTRIC